MISQRKAVFEYYYKYPESDNGVKIYKQKDNNDVYYAVGNEKVLLIQKNSKLIIKK